MLEAAPALAVCSPLDGGVRRGSESKGQKMKAGHFYDEWRGNGWHVSTARWTLALRLRWRFRFVRPPMKLAAWRLYLGPLEIERRS